MYQAAVLVYTPMLSRVDGFSAFDTAYDTRSRRSTVTPLSRTLDTSGIPIKRSRLSLPGINNSLTCKTEIDDFDFGINPTCSTNFKAAGNISTVLFDADSAMVSKPIVQKNENKSHYFKQEEQESESKSVVNMLYMHVYRNVSYKNETINNNILC